MSVISRSLPWLGWPRRGWHDEKTLDILWHSVRIARVFQGFARIILPSVFSDAEVAQSVEQRTENPRVGGSIPSLGTPHIKHLIKVALRENSSQ